MNWSAPRFHSLIPSGRSGCCQGAKCLAEGLRGARCYWLEAAFGPRTGNILTLYIKVGRHP